jgi:hypothetical protein
MSVSFIEGSASNVQQLTAFSACLFEPLGKFTQHRHCHRVGDYFHRIFDLLDLCVERNHAPCERPQVSDPVSIGGKDDGLWKLSEQFQFARGYLSAISEGASARRQHWLSPAQPRNGPGPAGQERLMASALRHYRSVRTRSPV